MDLSKRQLNILRKALKGDDSKESLRLSAMLADEILDKTESGVDLTVGDLYTVVEDHPFFGGMEGRFSFLGGTDRNVAVLIDHHRTTSRATAYICVAPKDLLPGSLPL